MDEDSNFFPTLKEIRDAHTWKWDYEKYLPLSRYVYRPLGFLVTWIAIRIGITTEMASYISAILGITGLSFLICKNHSFIIGGIILLHLFNLFDCVDGSIARATKTENPYGRFLDSIIGDTVNYAFFAVVGIMLFRNSNLAFYQTSNLDSIPFIWLIIGGGAAFSRILLQHTENIYAIQLKRTWNELSKGNTSNFGGTAVGLHTAKTRNRPNYFFHAIRLIDRNLRVRETHYLALIFAFGLCLVDVFLGFFLIYYSLRVVSAAFMFGRRAFILKTNQEQAENPIEDNSRTAE